MKRIHLQEDWPRSWKISYKYDLQEIYGEVRNRGYAYAYQNRREKTLGLITEVVAPGARILDIAAAQGNFSLTLAEMGYEVTWNDLRADLVDYVRLKQERGNITFAPGNAFELHFPDLFDAVLITEIIEHVAHPDQFLAKTASLVRPGGYVIMTTPNGAYFRNSLPKFSDCSDPAVYETVQFKPDCSGHIFLLHSDEIGQLTANAGLQLDKLIFFTTPLTRGHMKTEVLLRALPRGLVFAIESTTQHLPNALQQKTLVGMGARFQRPASGNSSV